MIDNTKEYILCAAVKRKIPREGNPYTAGTNDILNIEIGYRHHDIYERFKDELEIGADGFYTSRGRFVNRYEGMEVAYKAGQMSEFDALDKSWHHGDLAEWFKTNCTDTEGKPVILGESDTHEYNMLISEDLY